MLEIEADVRKDGAEARAKVRKAWPSRLQMSWREKTNMYFNVFNVLLIGKTCTDGWH